MECCFEQKDIYIKCSNILSVNLPIAQFTSRRGSGTTTLEIFRNIFKYIYNIKDFFTLKYITMQQSLKKEKFHH